MRHAPEAREREIEREILSYEEFADAAVAANQMAAAISALGKAGVLRGELGVMREAAEIAKIRDPIARLTARANAAFGQGSHGPAGTLLRDAEDLRDKRAAEKRERDEAAGKAGGWPAIIASIGEHVDRMPLPAREQLFAMVAAKCRGKTGTG